VFRLVALGHTNQAVAQQLSLSVKTIESYRSRLMAKLGLQNRAQLTQFAIEIGLLQSGTQKHEASDKL
jgi:DNA-binding NarL/FixJ family response regulator